MKKLIISILLMGVAAQAEESITATEPATIVATETQTTISAKASPMESAVTLSPSTTTTENTAIGKDESQIPLKIVAAKKEEATESALPKFMLGMAIFATLLAGTFFFIKKYSIRNRKNDLHQIKVLTQHHLGPRKSLAIIRVAGESILIGVTDQNISMIKSLSLLDEDIPQDTPQKFDQVMFQVDKVADKVTRKTEDEFTIRGIQDHVKLKLKEMKGIS